MISTDTVQANLMSQRIRHYVHLLLMVVLVLLISLIGYQYWLGRTYREAEDIASGYHLETISHCSKIKEDLQSILVLYAKEQSLFHGVGMQNLDEGKYSSHVYLLEKSFKDITLLHQAYRQASEEHTRFDPIVHKAGKQLSRIRSKWRETGAFDSTAFLASVEPIFPVLTHSIEQLSRLHMIAREELLKQLHELRKGGKRNLILAIIAVIVLGSLAVTVLLRQIGRLVVEQQGTESALRREIRVSSQTQDALHHHLRLEQLVARISACFSTLSSNELDAALNELLSDLGDFVYADRTYLFLLTPDREIMSNIHEWCATGIESKYHEIQELPTKGFLWAVEKLDRNEVLHVPDVAALPDEATQLKAVLDQGGIRSILNVPLYWGQRLGGIIGFDAVRQAKTWDEHDIRLLRTVGEIVSSTFERYETELELRERQAKLEEAQHIGRLGCWELDLESGQIVWSNELSHILGVPPDEPPSLQTLRERIHPDDWQRFQAAIDAYTRGETGCALEYRITHEDGKEYWVASRAKLERFEDSRPRRLLGTTQNINEHKQAERKLRQSAAVFENTKDGVLITDSVARIVAVNKSFTEITGFTEEEALGKKPCVLLSGWQDESFNASMWDTISQKGHWQGEIWDRRKNGETYTKWLTISAVRDHSGNLVNYVSVFSDISRIKQSEEKLQRLAHYDPLTELPNRLLLYSRLTHALDRAQRQNHKVAVLFLDLDHFKNINDGLGHPAGDELLRALAKRLSERLRKEDTFARLGGDEFIIVLEHVEQSNEPVAVAQDVLHALTQPFRLGGHRDVYIGGSIGVSFYPEDGQDAMQLMRNADAAMYQAKKRGRNTYQFYTETMTLAANQRLSMETNLRRALEREEFVVHYQPQVCMTTGKITGAEALVRWKHPEKGLIAPDHFIPVAEETGLIAYLGEWVLRTACAQTQYWYAAGLTHFVLAVNLSTRQFLQRNLVEKIAELLKECDMDTGCLQLEITESAIMESGEHVNNSLRALKALGVTLAIDDFGTGYSSLAYLKHFNIDKLKIDRSFVHDIPDDPNDATIVSSIIAMARSLKLRVNAEGVENDTQLNFLRSHHCHEFQGYLYSLPLPAEEFIQLLEKDQKQVLSR